MSATSAGTLLDGRLLYRQLLSGHRSGFEPVLLAAALQAAPGQAVLECGVGAGAALLCASWRLPGIFGVGVEIDETLARLAAANFRANGCRDLRAVQGDAATLPFGPVFDHAIANPPWHDPAGTPSPDAKRALAHRATPGLLARWITAMAGALRPAGSLTLILPAAAAPAATLALAAAGFGQRRHLPLLPRLGRPARQVILQSRRGPPATRAAPALVLHDAKGITPEAEAILRDGALLSVS